MLLLVAGHVYGLDSSNGMAVSGDTVGRYLTDSLEYLRMPLFTVISGYVYALRPVPDRSALPRFFRGKSRRLLLPLIPLTALIGTLQAVGGSASNSSPSFSDVAFGYLYGYSHLWFLYAIFLVMAVVALLDAAHLLDSARNVIITWAVTVAVFVALGEPDRIGLFSIDGAMRLLPFFLLGYGLVRHRALLEAPRVLAGVLALFAASFAVQQALLATGAGEGLGSAPLRVLSVAVGTTGIVCLFRIRHLVTVRALAWIGTYAFTIYLLHTIAAAGTKVVLGVIGVDTFGVIFTVAVVAAILLPIAFEVTLGRIDVVRVVLLGEKPLRRPW